MAKRIQHTVTYAQQLKKNKKPLILLNHDRNNGSIDRRSSTKW